VSDNDELLRKLDEYNAAREREGAEIRESIERLQQPARPKTATEHAAENRRLMSDAFAANEAERAAAAAARSDEPEAA
jgi:hypothetical protein